MEEFDIIGLLKYFKTKLVLIIIIFIIVVLGGVVYSKFFVNPMYKSESTLIIIDDKNFNPSTSYYELNKDLVNTYVELLQSDYILLETIKNLKLDKTTEEISNNLSVDPIGESHVIQLDFIGESKIEAKNIANEIIQVFDKKLDDFYQDKKLIVLTEPTEAKQPSNINYKSSFIKYILLGIILSFGFVFIIYYSKLLIKEIK